MTQCSKYPGNRSCRPLVRLQDYRKGKRLPAGCRCAPADSALSDGGLMGLWYTLTRLRHCRQNSFARSVTFTLRITGQNLRIRV